MLANEVLVDMLPSLRESQPRVLRLIEGGEVEDEGLVERLFALHEQLSYCVGKYDELAGAAAPPPPAAAAPAAAPAPAPAAAIFDLDLLSDPDAGNAAFVPVAAAPSLAAATAGAIARPAALPGEDLLFTGGMGHLADAAPLTTRDDEGVAPSDEAHGPPPTEPPPPPPAASAPSTPMRLRSRRRRNLSRSNCRSSKEASKAVAPLRSRCCVCRGKA